MASSLGGKNSNDTVTGGFDVAAVAGVGVFMRESVFLSVRI
jgi:hypothetical protein